MPLLRPRPSSAATRIGALLALAALLVAAPAKAQSLKEVYEAARAFDATYLSARALAESAQYRVAQVEALARGTASLVGNATTGRVELQHGPGGDSHAVGARLDARLPLFNRFNDAAIEQARRQLEAARADLEAAEQELIVRAAQAYFDVLAAQDTLETTRTSKAAITEQLASAKRNFEVGTATITDTREAQARFDLATAQEVAAEYDLRTKRSALDGLVGRAGVAPRPPLVPFVPPPVLPADPEAWVVRADDLHPTVRRVRVALDTAVLETAKARGEGMPVVDAIGSVGSSRASGSAAASLPGLNHTATVGVEVRWPFYTGGRVQNRIRETLVLEDKARQDLEAARRDIAQGTRAAFFSLQSLQAQVKALEAAEASSKLALEATQLGYRVGVRVNLDVLNAQTQLFQTQRDLAKARYDVLVAGLRLRRASGQLAAPDIEVVNAMLAR
jgi:outer membrane protein